MDNEQLLKALEERVQALEDNKEWIERRTTIVASMPVLLLHFPNSWKKEAEKLVAALDADTVNLMPTTHRIYNKWDGVFGPLCVSRELLTTEQLENGEGVGIANQVATHHKLLLGCNAYEEARNNTNVGADGAVDERLLVIMSHLLETKKASNNNNNNGDGGEYDDSDNNNRSQVVRGCIKSDFPLPKSWAHFKFVAACYEYLVDTGYFSCRDIKTNKKQAPTYQFAKFAHNSFPPAWLAVPGMHNTFTALRQAHHEPRKCQALASALNWFVFPAMMPWIRSYQEQHADSIFEANWSNVIFENLGNMVEVKTKKDEATGVELAVPEGQQELAKVLTAGLDARVGDDYFFVGEYDPFRELCVVMWPYLMGLAIVCKLNNMEDKRIAPFPDVVFEEFIVAPLKSWMSSHYNRPGVNIKDIFRNFPNVAEDSELMTIVKDMNKLSSEYREVELEKAAKIYFAKYPDRSVVTFRQRSNALSIEVGVYVSSSFSRETLGLERTRRTAISSVATGNGTPVAKSLNRNNNNSIGASPVKNGPSGFVPIANCMDPALRLLLKNKLVNDSLFIKESTGEVFFQSAHGKGILPDFIKSMAATVVGCSFCLLNYFHQHGKAKIVEKAKLTAPEQKNLDGGGACGKLTHWEKDCPYCHKSTPFRVNK